MTNLRRQGVNANSSRWDIRIERIYKISALEFTAQTDGSTENRSKIDIRRTGSVESSVPDSHEQNISIVIQSDHPEQ